MKLLKEIESGLGIKFTKEQKALFKKNNNSTFMAQCIDPVNWQAIRCEIQGIKFAYDPDCMSIDELNELQSDMAEMAKKMKEMSENLFDLIRQKEYPQ